MGSVMVRDWLTSGAAAGPDRPAVVAGGRTVSWAELEALADASASRPAERHGALGGRVAGLAGPAGLGFVVAVHALWRAGAVVAPIEQGLPDTALDRARRRLEAQFLVEVGGTGDAGPEPGARMTGPCEHPSETEALRLLTSGTTGEPSVVPLTHGNLRASADGAVAVLGEQALARWLCVLPLHHVGGLATLTRSAVGGGCVEVHPRFDAVAASAALDAGVSGVSLVAATLQRLLDAGAPLDRPRVLLVGGGPVPAALLHAVREQGGRVAHTWGMTETGSMVAVSDPADPAPAGVAGRPIAGAEVRVEEGELLVRGPMVSPSALDADGWLRTGDRGERLDDGRVRVRGRLDELIISGGENVSPEAVEEALRAAAGVADATVIGVPDPEWGSAVVAFIEADPAEWPEPDALRAHCAKRLPRHHVPKRIEIVAALPRTSTGKVARSRLPRGTDI
ncbi:MAG: class I adenylate-forming enzyme family protein [Solirubrobacterales bacterium]